jgi:hypothetical protein
MLTRTATEFGLSWDQYAAESDYLSFLPQAMSTSSCWTVVEARELMSTAGFLDSEPQVAGYSWFGAFSDGTAKNLIGTNGSLTELGQLYVS